MQVNNSASSVYSAQSTQVQPSARSVPNERANSVRPSNASLENQPERTARIESSESAIAQLEQTLQGTSLGANLGNNPQSANQQTSYDQPSQRNNTALSAYQSVDNLEQRENVQQLLGVDVYA